MCISVGFEYDRNIHRFRWLIEIHFITKNNFFLMFKIRVKFPTVRCRSGVNHLDTDLRPQELSGVHSRLVSAGGHAGPRLLGAQRHAPPVTRRRVRHPAHLPEQRVGRSEQRTAAIPSLSLSLIILYFIVILLLYYYSLIILYIYIFFFV